jgi:hypothetical protein
MIRNWSATALLAGSWLFGLGYYQPANVAVWLGLLMAALLLLGDVPVPRLSCKRTILAVVLLLPSAWIVSFPSKAIPLLLAGGLLLTSAPLPRRWPRWLGQGAVAGAAILLAQSLALEGHAMLTARAHELPAPLAQLLAAVPRALGVETALDGSWLVLRSLEQAQRVGATWDLLLDAASVCFLVGGWVLLGLRPHSPCGRTTGCIKRWLIDALCLAAFGAIWAPMRAAVLIGIWLQRSLRADSLGDVNVADVFVNGWLHLLLLAGPVFFAICVFVRRRTAQRPAWSMSQNDTTSSCVPVEPAGGRFGIPLLLIAAGTGLAAFLWHWEPVGQPQSGRIMIVERHSTWEPTTTPYGTTVYGEAGSYNYAAAYDYCGQYFQMSRLLETDAIDDGTLAECDVLVIKTPTSRYAEDEIAAVVRFVQRGGALLMIGDHTNVFNMNTSLNDVSRHFGFSFRNDLLFRVGTPYVQKYRPPVVASPIVQHVPPMNFAVSCSIDPGWSTGRMVVRSAGLYSLPPAYHESNYHPQAEYRPNMHFGAWCQLWSCRYGQGRVLAFADSTLFSNFCVFQPGKAELLRGMLNWLNHRSLWDRRAPRLGLVLSLGMLAALLLAWGVWIGRRPAGTWVLWVASGYAGWALASLAVFADHRQSLPAPAVQRALPHVVLDRTVSEVPLFTGAFADDKDGLGYGLFEQWIPRIGNWTSRATGPDVFAGDAIVIVCPTRSVTPEYQQRLVEFVAGGGRLLVLDSPDVQGSTVNSILWPFGMASSAVGAEQNAGDLTWADDLQIPPMPLLASCRIDGGQGLAHIGETPVAAQVRHGRGLVTAVGFGSLFNDTAMGTHWLPPPEQDTLQRYELLYGLLRASLPYKLHSAQVSEDLTDATAQVRVPPRD